MCYLKKINPVLVCALALVLAPTLTQAKNSPTYPQLQQNGGTAAVGDKDGGGSAGPVERIPSDGGGGAVDLDRTPGDGGGGADDVSRIVEAGSVYPDAFAAARSFITIKLGHYWNILKLSFGELLIVPNSGK